MALKVACRYLWALPTTLVGLPFVIGSPGRRWHTGVLELHGGLSTFFLTRLVPLPGGASAMTLGHIVIARDTKSHDWTRSHERIHVAQVERWGPLFIPAYFAASLYLKARGKDAYRDNPFEIEAYAKG